MAYKVTLTWYEQMLGGVCGILRENDSHERNQHRDLFSGEDSLTNNIYAACAEIAVAKLTNRYWIAGVGDGNLADVGRYVEVRWSKCHHRLRVSAQAHDDRPYVFVRGSNPRFEIVGWMLGRDAKQQCWKATNFDGDWYLVPSESLKDMKALVRKTP